MVKRILCFGDSNTWGYMPGTGQRFNYDQRWPGILAEMLEEKYQVIEEGLNGRTIAREDPTRPGRNGLDYLIPCLESHRPLDMVIVYLGTNNLKHFFHQSAQDITEDMEKMIRVIQNIEYGFQENPPQIILLSIPYVQNVQNNTVPGSPFTGAREKSIQLAVEYQKLAIKNQCHFLDISTEIQTSPIDGVHLNHENHRRLTHLLASKIREIDENLS